MATEPVITSNPYIHQASHTKIPHVWTKHISKRLCKKGVEKTRAMFLADDE